MEVISPVKEGMVEPLASEASLLLICSPGRSRN